MSMLLFVLFWSASISASANPMSVGAEGLKYFQCLGGVDKQHKIIVVGTITGGGDVSTSRNPKSKGSDYLRVEDVHVVSNNKPEINEKLASLGVDARCPHMNYPSFCTVASTPWPKESEGGPSVRLPIFRGKRYVLFLSKPKQPRFIDEWFLEGFENIQDGLGSSLKIESLNHLKTFDWSGCSRK